MSPTYGDLVSSYAAWVQALLPTASPRDPVFSAHGQAAASAVADLYAYLDAQASVAFLSLATGAALAAKCADYGQYKVYGVAATASLTLTLAGVPAGYAITPAMIFGTAGDALTPPVLFAPTGTTNLSAGQASAVITARAQTAGLGANVVAGAINRLTLGSPYITAVTNAAPAAGGTDDQTDQSLLAQTQASLSPMGTITQLGRVAASVPGVTAALVVDLADALGTINVYALDAGNVLTGATTTPAVPTTGEALLIMQALQPAGCPGLTFKVAAFTVTTQAITVHKVTQAPGSGLTQALVTTAIQTYLNGLGAGATFFPSQLQQYLFVTAFPSQLVDLQLSSTVPVTVATTGIVRAGAVSYDGGSGP